jgi:hypothetical protein
LRDRTAPIRHLPGRGRERTGRPTKETPRPRGELARASARQPEPHEEGLCVSPRRTSLIPCGRDGIEDECEEQHSREEILDQLRPLGTKARSNSSADLPGSLWLVAELEVGALVPLKEWCKVVQVRPKEVCAYGLRGATGPLSCEFIGGR